MDLSEVLILDAVVLAGCTSAILARGANHFHPGVMYLLFHAIVFSYRGWSIQGGSLLPWGVTPELAAEALLIADIFLVCATAGWTLEPRVSWSETRRSAAQLRPGVVFAVSLVAMPVGLYFLATRTYTAGSGTVDREFQTAYEFLAVTWPGLLLLAAIYVRGFRWYYLIPFVAYIGYMGVQGAGRYRVLLPLIFLMMLWLERKGRRWPSPRIVVACVALVPTFVAMDGLGTAYRSGQLSYSGVVAAVEEAGHDVMEGSTTDQYGLDALAVAVDQSRRLDVTMWGRDYLSIIVLPVPRTWWPDKPVQSQAVVELSTPDRPLADIGAVLTFPGSLWVDFRWIGIVVGGLLWGRLSLWAFSRAKALGYGSVNHFLYLVIASALIQIYRDTPISLISFTLVKSLPLIVMAVICLMLKEAEGPSRHRAPVEGES